MGLDIALPSSTSKSKVCGRNSKSAMARMMSVEEMKGGTQVGGGKEVELKEVELNKREVQREVEVDNSRREPEIGGTNQKEGRSKKGNESEGKMSQTEHNRGDSNRVPSCPIHHSNQGHFRLIRYIVQVTNGMFAYSAKNMSHM